MRLNILHTNDVHSRFEKFAQIAAMINEWPRDCSLLLDGGDFNDFMRIELEGTGGRAGVELLDMVGYDAIAVGNNETFQGIEMLEAMASAGKVPFLSSNLKKAGLLPVIGLKNSIILERIGVRVLVIGISPNMRAFYSLMGFDAIALEDGIRAEMNLWQDAYDLCLILSHSGIETDRKLAQSLPGIDVIIGGHSHTLMESPEIVGNTIIHHSGCYGDYLGVLELELMPELAAEPKHSSFPRIESFTGRNIRVDSYAPDNRILDLIGRQRELAIDRLSELLYSIDRTLWHDVMEENPLTNLLADGLKDLFDCDLSVINSGVLNGGIVSGPVTPKKLLELCPSPLNPTFMQVKGKDLRQALAQSLYADVCLQEGKGSGFRGRYLGRLHVSGVEIYHNDRIIEKILIGTEPLDDERVYAVGTSDYLQRGTGYPTLAHNSGVRYRVEYLRETLGQYLRRKDYVENAFRNRWIKVD